MKEAGEWSRALRGELYERWPKDANGEPEEPVPSEATAAEAEAPAAEAPSKKEPLLDGFLRKIKSRFRGK